MAKGARLEDDKTLEQGYWEPEDNVFWEAAGKQIAYRNLWISIPCLLCAFGVWKL